MMKMNDNQREKSMVMKVLLFYLFTFLPLSVYGYELKRVSVHDPSVVWNPSSKTYYIFGSHRAAAKTTDLMSWTAFSPTYDYSKYDPAVWSGGHLMSSGTRR